MKSARRVSRGSCFARRQRPSRTTGRRTPRFELLEDRRVLSTFTVSTAVDESDGDFSPGDLSLREAIELANAQPNADTIQFDAGLAGQPILLTLGELSIEQSVTMTGLGSSQTIVDAQDGNRVLSITGGDVRLQDMTMTRGIAPGNSQGGAIFNAGTLAITDSVISRSRSNTGGGIYNEGTLTLENSTVAENKSIAGFPVGGGIFNAGAATITDSVISSNESGVGGGIHNAAGATMTIAGSQFTGNVASSNPGGGIYNVGALSIVSSSFSSNRALDGGAISSGGVLTLSDCTISGNRAQWEGGGIYNFGEATITSTELSDNIATKYFGGAIANNEGMMSIVDSTVSANQAGRRGGGIENWCASLTITNSTISGNKASEQGSAIGNKGWDDPSGGQAEVTLNNVTIAGNSSANGAGIYNGDLADLTIANTIIANDGSSADVFREGDNTVTLLGVNLVEDGSITGPGVINADPLLGSLADNGGATLTHSLISGSPAVNAGDDSVLPPDVTDADNDGDTSEPIPFDQRGEGFDRILGASVDLGAFEGEVAGGPVPILYFSLDKSASGGGVSAADEDIIQLDDQGTFSKVFDGSDVGVGALKLDAFSVNSDTEILMSFTAAGTVGGMSVDDSDVVLFTATSLGEDTAGSWSMYFDGSSFGLTTNNENVDAVELLPNGHLLISTAGNVTVPGVSGADEDLLEFAPATGSWSMYFDGSDVGLATSNYEDVNALGLDSAGNLYLSTVGDFSVPGVAGADEDVFVFRPTSLGWSTAGTFDADLYFDGSAFGLAGWDLFGVDIPAAGQPARATAATASPSEDLADAALLAYLAADFGTPERNKETGVALPVARLTSLAVPEVRRNPASGCAAPVSDDERVPSNAGDTALVPSDVPFHQRGSGFGRVVGGSVDMGAFELSADVPSDDMATLKNAATHGRVLVLQGGSADDHILVKMLCCGQVFVTPSSGSSTTINGSSEGASFRHIDMIRTNAGEDDLKRAAILGSTNINLGEDDDALNVIDSLFGGDALADGGLGDDLLSLLGKNLFLASREARNFE